MELFQALLLICLSPVTNTSPCLAITSEAGVSAYGANGKLYNGLFTTQAACKTEVALMEKRAPVLLAMGFPGLNEEDVEMFAKCISIPVEGA